MTDLNQLKQLITFFEEGTITRASEKLLISQPALTRSLQRLEEDLGVTLFERKKNKTTFTDTGLFVVEEAMKLLTHAEHFEQVVRHYELKNTTLFIGVCAPGPTVELENNMKEKESSFKADFKLSDEDTLLKNLFDETNQVIITDYELDDERVVSKPFLKEQLHISLLPTHPLADKKEVELADLEHLTMLVLTDLGIWEDILEGMSKTHFIRQQDSDAFNDLITASALPHFSTNITHQYFGYDEGKVDLPIIDKVATKTFYINVLKKNKQLINTLV